MVGQPRRPPAGAAAAGALARSMIDVIATQRIKPGTEAEVEALLRQTEHDTLANDKGCLRYEWYRSQEPCAYVLIERWEDGASVQAHFKAPHLAKALAALEPYAVEKFTVQRLSRLD